MKKSIYKKIIQINVLVVLFVLTFMSLVSIYTIKAYIQNDKAEDLLKELRLIRLFIVDGYETIDSDEEVSKQDKTQNRAIRAEYESRTVILIKDSQNTWRQQRVKRTQINTPLQKITLSNEEIEEITTNIDLLKTGDEKKRPVIINIGGEECLAVALKIPQVQNKNRNKLVDRSIDRNRLTGRIMVTYIPMTEINVIKNKIVRVMILSMLIGGFVAIIICWLLSKKITNPIIRLKAIAIKYADRDFTEKATIKTGDEIEDLAEAINIMAENIHQYDKHQKEFLQDISHELKTPLMSIQGYAEGLKEEMFDDRDQVLNIIIDESIRMKKFIKDIIYSSKLDMIQESFEFQKCSMNEIIIHSIEKIESIAILNDIDILYTPQEDVQLIVDQGKMIQVLINLLSNCLKYTKDIIQIDTSYNNTFFEIRIRDNGKGFGDKDLNKIFDRFYKGDKEGSGLGMSIVKKIIHGHNGEIIASKVMTGGSEFSIKLPL